MKRPNITMQHLSKIHKHILLHLLKMCAEIMSVQDYMELMRQYCPFVLLLISFVHWTKALKIRAYHLKA